MFKSKFLTPFIAATLVISIVVGQFLRLQIFNGSSGALLASDILTLLLASVFWVAVVLRRISLPVGMLSKGFFIWVSAITFSTFLASLHYGHVQVAVGVAYLIRLFAYVSMLFVSYALFAKLPNLIIRYLAYGAFGLLVLGAIILYILPDFAALAPMGWDPHVNRLTSTWLDPNFFGSFLALLFAFFLAYAARAEQSGQKFIRFGYYAFLLLLWLGIYLTYSRSALATLAVGGISVGLLTRWRNLLLVVVLLGVMIALPSRLQSRFAASVNYSVSTVSKSTATSSSVPVTNIDPTASDRVQSWKRAISIFKANPIFGTGYNFYQYYRLEHGQASVHDVTAIHGVAGSDSSLLTLLATTGIVGTAALTWWWGNIVRFLWKRRKGHPLVVGTLGMLLAWVASSFFNNTLLYPHILLPVMLIVGIALAVPNEDERAA